MKDLLEAAIIKKKEIDDALENERIAKEQQNNEDQKLLNQFIQIMETNLIAKEELYDSSDCSERRLIGLGWIAACEHSGGEWPSTTCYFLLEDGRLFRVDKEIIPKGIFRSEEKFWYARPKTPVHLFRGFEQLLIDRLITLNITKGTK